MSWFGGNKSADGAASSDQSGKGKSPMPPPCPRCEQTKTQFSKAVANYQRVYMRKVDGLKMELGSVRRDRDRLQTQNNRLRRSTLFTFAVGLGIGLVARRAYREGKAAYERLLEELKKRKAGAAQADDEDETRPAQPLGLSTP